MELTDTDFENLEQTAFKGLTPTPVDDVPMEAAERLSLIKGMLADRKRPKSAHPSRRPLLYYPGLPARPIYEPSEFPWVPFLLAHVDDFVEELSALERRGSQQHTFHTVWPDFTAAGEWAALWLRLYGEAHEANADLTPRTLSAVEQIPALAGWLGFSAMAPHTHVSPHCGVTNAKLRCHVPLELTAGGSRIRIADRTHVWKKGEVLIFDDSFEHEVWNDSDARRVMLIFDLYHPALTADEIDLLTFMEKCTVRKSYNALMQKYQAESSDVGWLYDSR